MSTKSELLEHRGILVIGFLMAFFTFAVPTYSMPFIYAGAVEEFGWSREQVNLLSTAKFMVGALAALGMGILVDRFGARWITVFGSLVGGVAMLLFIRATELPIYYLAGALLGFSASSVLAAIKIIVSRSFGAAQGTAMGIVLTATSVAGVIMPQIMPPMMQAFGWRMTMGYLSVGVLFIAIPIWLIAIWRLKDLRETAAMTTTGGTGLWQHFKLISRDRNFWLMGLGIFLVSGVDQSMMHNYVLFLREDKGFDWRAIAWGGSLLALVSIVAKIGSGWIYDRFSIRGIMVFYMLLGVSIFLGLPVMGFASVILFLVVRGIAHGGLIVDVPILSKHYFGMQHFGLTMGIMSLFMQLGFAVGPPVLGRMADAAGNYTSGLVVYGTIALLASLTLLPVKPRYWTPPGERL
jgi:MFS family permease